MFFHLISLHRPYNIASIDSESDATLNYYRDALNYVKEYLCNGITPNDVAEFLHLSPSYLRTIFRKHCEYSLQEYMIRKRIEMAADQLKHGNHSVKEAATAVGYDDPAQFCKMFKKHMGVSPKKYRELDP